MRRRAICRNRTAMQISRLLLPVCVAAFGMAALPLRAEDNATQSAPPTAKSQKTPAGQTTLKKQAEANVPARKETGPQPTVETQANKPADAPAQEQAQTTVVTKQGQPEKSVKKAEARMKPAAFKPIERPPLPTSEDKAQRLTALLLKYRADEITPGQYQAERARILAEP